MSKLIQFGEAVVSKAIKYRDRIFRGATHDDAMGHLQKLFPAHKSTGHPMDFGFYTSQNRFINKKEADTIYQPRLQAAMAAIRQQMSSRQKLIQFDDDSLQPHQRRVIKKILEAKRRGLVIAHGLGSGKTRTAIEAHKALGGDADVVLPSALRANYAKETEKWTGPKANVISQQAVALRGSDALKSPLLIVDEGHRARNPKSKISEALKASPASKRLILSGTPIYNNPSDIATLVNQAAGKNVLPEGESFKRRYLRPHLLDRLTGRRISKSDELKKKLNEYVDYHKGDPGSLPKVTATTIPVDLGKHQSALYHASQGKIPPGLKMHADNIHRLAPYLTGARQVSNTSKALDPKSNEEPKLDRVVNDLKEHLKSPKGKALVYSNWLDHGIKPIQKRLTEAGIPHGVFTGDESPKVRDQHVRDYNSGKHRALIVSSSGSEGLDLKGTRMVQVVEPHFNNAKIRQVVGRSARMGSHTHLPPEDRTVEVRQYVGRPRRRFFGGSKKGVDDFLSDVARKKDETNKQITALLSSKGKPIQFALPGVMAKKYLHGTHWNDSPLSAALLDAATKQDLSPKDEKGKPRIYKEPHPSYPEGRRMIRDTAGNRRLPRAQDFRDAGAFDQARRAVHQDRIEQIRAKPLKDQSALWNKLSDQVEASKDLTRPQRIAATRSAIAKDLNRQRLIVHAVRREKGVPGEDTIPGRRKGPQHGAKQPHMAASNLPEILEKANENLPAATERVRTAQKLEHDTLYQEVKTKAQQAVEAQDKRKSTGYKPSGNIESRTHDALAPLRRSIINAPKDAKNPSSGIFQRPDYEPLSVLVGKSPEEVAGLHERMNKLRTGASPANAAAIEKQVIKSGDIFIRGEGKVARKAAKAAFDNTKTKFPHLKLIGATGAAVGGAALLAKLLKKKEEKRMSAKGRVIEFARGSGYMSYVIKKHGFNGDLSHLGRKERELIGVRVAAAKGNREVFKQRASKLGLTHPISNERLGAAHELRAWRKEGLGRAGINPSLIGTGKMHGVGGIREIDSPALQSYRGSYLGGSDSADYRSRFVGKKAAEIDKMMQGKVAEQASDLKGRYSANIRDIQDKTSANINKAREETQRLRDEKEKLKRSILKRVGIGAGIGAASGAVGTYAGTRPRKELEFSVSDLILQNTVAVQNAIWRGERQAGRIFRRAARKHPVLIPVANGIETGIKTGAGMTAGASLGLGRHLYGKIPAVRKGRVEAIMRRIENRKATRLDNPSNRVIRFDALADWKKRLTHNDTKTGVSAHDVVTGGLEGGIGVLATDPLIKRITTGRWESPLEHGISGLGKKAAIGAGVGAVATGSIGYLLNKLAANRKKQPVQTELSAILFAAPPANRSAVTKDRYVKKIHEDDMARAERNYVRSAVGGAAIASLLRKTSGLSLGHSALAGGGAGILAQALVRHGTSQTKDQFGDRTYYAKRTDNIPGQLALAGAGAIGAHGLVRSIVPKAERAGAAAKKISKLGRFFGLSNQSRVIQFEKYFVPAGSTVEVKGPPKQRRPRDWTDKWIGTEKRPVNISRRYAEIHRATSRVGGLLKDTKGVLTGEKAVDSRGRPRKREWEKPYVKKYIGYGLLAAGVGGVGLVRHATAKGAPGHIGELGRMWRKGTIGQAAKNTFPKTAGVIEKAKGVFGRAKNNTMDEAIAAVENAGDLRNKGKNSYLKRFIDSTKKAAGEVPVDKSPHQVPHADGSVTLHPYDSPVAQKARLEGDELKKAMEAREAEKKARRARGDITGLLNARLDSILEFDYAYAGPEPRVEGDLLRVARIHRRDRRGKRWGEREENKRLIKNAEISSALVGGTILGALFRHKAGVGRATGSVAEHIAPEAQDILKAIHRYGSLDPLLSLSSQLNHILTL